MVTGIGTVQLVMFTLVVVVLFGGRLPGAVRSLGTGIREFRQAVRDPERLGDEAPR